jgi:transcriptional regulator of acetoin/glycerol metabolism
MASQHRQLNIDEARRKFANGELGQLAGARNSILESWIRCRESGLSFGDNAIFNPITRARQKRLEDRNHDFIARSTADMERLFSVLRGAHWAVSLIDAEGYVIKTVREAMPAFKGIEMAFRPGVNLGEATAGTTGPACVLADGKLAVVSGQEHFLDEAGEFTCTSAPIYDPQARLVGVLNASRRFSGGRDGIPVPVMLTAQAIGNNLVRALPGAIVIDIACPLDTGEQTVRGSLAINPAGEIIGASQTARLLLGLGQDDTVHFAELFAEPLGVTIDRLRAARHSRIALTTQGGLQLFASTGDTHGPTRLHGTGQQLPPADKGPLPQEFSVALSKAQLAFNRDIPILINGDTGTGKEVIAQYLHTHGRRAAGPFVALNCSSIPASLIESELFGHEPGAFTGATKTGMAGKFEQANGGTLFLDEIGDMPVDLQTRLLRVIQERRVCRVGGTTERELDFSLISATHRDLPTQIGAGLFREDLYYRLNGLRIKLPPLRERSDFKRIVERILAEEADEIGTITLGEATLNALKSYAWPGNIRELRQVLRLACAMSNNGVIELAHLPPEIAPPDTNYTPLSDNPLELAERDVFANKFAAHRGNIAAVARSLKLSRATVYKKLREYRII